MQDHVVAKPRGGADSKFDPLVWRAQIITRLRGRGASDGQRREQQHRKRQKSIHRLHAQQISSGKSLVQIKNGTSETMGRLTLFRSPAAEQRLRELRSNLGEFKLNLLLTQLRMGGDERHRTGLLLGTDPDGSRAANQS